MEDNKNFSSSDSSEDGKTPTQSPGMVTKFPAATVTKSDIANQNLTMKLDDNELNCSSLDTLKDYNFYSKSLDDSKTNNQIDNGAKELNKRSSYYSDGSYSFKRNVDPRNSYVIDHLFPLRCVGFWLHRPRRKMALQIVQESTDMTR